MERLAQLLCSRKTFERIFQLHSNLPFSTDNFTIGDFILNIYVLICTGFSNFQHIATIQLTDLYVDHFEIQRRIAHTKRFKRI